MKGERSNFQRLLFQNLFSFDVPVEVDRAAGARTIAQGVPVFTHLKARPPGNLKSRALVFFLAVEDVPTGGQDHKIPEAGQGKPPLVNEAVDLVDLRHLKRGIKAVIGVFLPQRLDEALFLIFPDALLGKVHQPRDFVDEKELSSLAVTLGAFHLSPRHLPPL
jgi:hypothetical protein